MSWDDGLSDERRSVISYNGTHARLLAGPGTGKTWSLIKKLTYLIEELAVSPSTIYVLTFTRAAAAELNDRVKKELIDLESYPKISTLHSFALKLILKNPARTRLPIPIRIADKFEEKEFIEADMRDLLGIRKNEVHKKFQQLSADWGRLAEFPDARFLGAWDEHRQIYGYTLLSELVFQFKGALEEEDFTLPQINYLLVDEYQDLNPCDLDVIKYLADFGAELFVAGDDDQSIYGFRFANPDGIRNFTEEYDPSKHLELNECRRCDKNILALGLFVIESDLRRIPKTLHCKSDAEDGIVKILKFTEQEEEANGIARMCNYLINQKNIDPSEIMILLSSDKNNSFSRIIRDALIQQNVPVKIFSNPLAPLDTDEGRIFLCILQLIVNPTDSLAWRVLLQKRTVNGIGDETFKKVYAIAVEQGISFYDSLELVSENPDLVPMNGKKVKQEINFIKAIIDENKVDSIDNLSDFIGDLVNKYIENQEIRDDIKSIFLNVIRSSVGKISLEDSLSALNVSLSNKEQDLEEGLVSIMTMHQSKGLTADAVFIVAAEDELIPGRNLSGDRKDDSRRLLYVSLTRARHYLFITHCQRRTGAQLYAGRNTHTPFRRLSRFISRQNVFPSESGEDYLQLLGI